MKVAVFGCGPAGLLVAHAAHTMGHEVHIYSRLEQSPIGGAQYLHRAIPGITESEPEFQIEYVKIGDRSVYAGKAYGTPYAVCSWDLWDGLHDAWSLRDAYKKLWSAYEDLITPVRSIDDIFIAASIEGHDLVFNSIPKRVICIQRYHTFDSNPAWLVPLLPDEGKSIGENTIIYNGNPNPIWHRASRIQDEAWLEYAVPRPNGTMVQKPQHTDCDCWGASVIGIGRYGLWQRDILSDSAYLTAVEWLV